MRVMSFFTIAMTVWYGSHAYVAARLIMPLGLATAGKVVAWLFALALASLFPLTMTIMRSGPVTPWREAFAWISWLYFSFAMMILPVSIIRDLALGAARLAGLLPAASVRQALASANTWVVAAAVILTGIGYLQARAHPRIEEVRVKIPGLAPDLEGFRIVLLCDLHAGGTMVRGQIEYAVKTANALAPDLVALAGDLADGRVLDAGRALAPLSGLKARHGVFFVMGNHDYFWEPARWAEFARGLGFHVLVNEHSVIRHGRAVMVVAGLPDPHGGMHGPSQVPDLAAAVRGAPRGDFRLLIVHQPRETIAGAKEGFQLAVAGHTHGGQTFPWSLLNPFFHPFTRGLNRVGDMYSYVSRGTGYWGPPNRLGVPGEITLLILTGR